MTSSNGQEVILWIDRDAPPEVHEGSDGPEHLHTSSTRAEWPSSSGAGRGTEWVGCFSSDIGKFDFVASMLAAVVVEAADPARLADYWAALLEYPSVQFAGAAYSLELADDVTLSFLPSGAGKQGKNSLHLDLASTSVAHQSARVERACLAGGTRIDIGQGSVPWVVVADPEGNEFCVLEPRDEYREVGAVAAVVIDAVNPVALCEFWSEALSLPITRRHAEYASLKRPSGFWLEFVRNTDSRLDRKRFHLRLAANESRSDGEAEQPGVRAATVAGWPDHVCRTHWKDTVALLDPESNEFCLAALPRS